jgi:hypothetical protein
VTNRNRASRNSRSLADQGTREERQPGLVGFVRAHPTLVRSLIGLVAALIGFAAAVVKTGPTWLPIIEQWRNDDPKLSNNEPISKQGGPKGGEPPSRENNVAVARDDLLRAVDDYYEAVDREDWSYTYENLAPQTRSRFGEEEWSRKNEWIADEKGLELSSWDKSIEEFSLADHEAALKVHMVFEDGTKRTTHTRFFYDERSWKNELSPAEMDSLMPETPYQEFVEAHRKAAVESAIRSHYKAIGKGEFEEAYGYFGPTARSDHEKEEWIKNHVADDIESSTIHSVEVTEANQDTATATVDVSFEDNTIGTSRYVFTWSLVNENGEWKLDQQLWWEQLSGTS